MPLLSKATQTLALNDYDCIGTRAEPCLQPAYLNTRAGQLQPVYGNRLRMIQGSCTDMTGSVQGTVKIGSDGWVSGYLTNNSNRALFVSYTFKQNGVPSKCDGEGGGTTIQGGQTVGGEGQGLYSTGADKKPLQKSIGMRF